MLPLSCSVAEPRPPILRCILQQGPCTKILHLLRCRVRPHGRRYMKVRMQKYEGCKLDRCRSNPPSWQLMRNREQPQRTSKRPRLGLSLPARTLRAVDLPMPFVPTSPSTCPGLGTGSLRGQNPPLTQVALPERSLDDKLL